MSDEHDLPDEIARSAEEVATVLKAVDGKTGKFVPYELRTLKYLLGDEGATVRMLTRDPELTVDVEDLHELYEDAEQARKQYYAKNLTTAADGVGFQQNIYEWVLGGNEAYDHLL